MYIHAAHKGGKSMHYNSNRYAGCRMMEYDHNGLCCLCMENEVLKMTILLNKGADIFEIIYKPMDMDLLWKMPCGIDMAYSHIPSVSMTNGNFFDHYPGGWQQIIPGGGPCEYKGAQIGLHGEACLLPWRYRILEDTAEKISVELYTQTIRMPLEIRKTITIESNIGEICFQDTVRNLSEEEIQCIWGQHPAYGGHFIDDSCIIETPAKYFIAGGQKSYIESTYESGYKDGWPFATDMNGVRSDLSHLPAVPPKSIELFFLGDLEEGRYKIINTRKKISAGLKWDKAVFPYLWHWRVLKGDRGYPLYGRSYHIALEPFSSYPNSLPEAISNGTALKLNPNGKIDTRYIFTVNRE
jgi:hypothetical protein